MIRPLVYVRETETETFAESSRLPIVSENCPACFEAPKERYRLKCLLATQARQLGLSLLSERLQRTLTYP